MLRKLTITADDYGLTPLIDEAIISALRLKRINSVAAFSVPPVGPLLTNQLKENYEKLRDISPDLSLGLHFSITAGTPLTNCSTVIKKNKGRWVFKLPKEIELGRLNIDEIRQELTAQYAAFREANNDSEPQHISCHHNILYFKKELFDLLTDIASEVQVPIRTPRNLITIGKFHSVRELNPALIPLHIEHGLNALNWSNLKHAIKAIGKKEIDAQVKQLRARNLLKSDYFLIHHYGNPDVEIFKRIYPNIDHNEHCEQIMHLALDPKNFDKKSIPRGINKGYLSGRYEEYGMLISNEFHHVLNSELAKAVNPLIF